MDASTAAATNLRRRLAGEGSVATFVIVPRVEIVELAALAGFDAVILDQEHGPIGVETLPPLVAAARGAGLACLVRVPEGRAKQIEAAFDVGADGVLVPHVSSSAAAADAVAHARFAPEGRRGANPYVRAAAYSANERFFSDANARAACLALVEGKQGVRAIGEILAVPGLDAVFIGPIDLSAALGTPGQPEHSTVIETVRGLVERGRERGVATAVFAPTPEAARRWLSLGVRLVALSVDTGLILGGFRAALAQLRA